ncbi:MAG: PKD domain-containing protein [candidate division SR1 bacterium]|nr:PKD domain-containing protein [candidate division SR1 bacterium]
MIVALCAIFFIGKIHATIPTDYIANYEITTDYNKIMGLFVDIDAATKVGTQIPQAKFSELNTSFQTVFPKFPQDYAFKVTYQQCLDITQSLITYTSIDYQTKLSSFMTNCYKPFSDIVKKVNSKYTIIASAKVSPQGGPAPLTVTFDGRASVDPSNDTIPSKNYYRYYRDIDGNDTTIGVGPVVNTTFASPGNYQVHLTVRSSNKATDGIFDGEKTISIDVLPKTANIVVYANGQKLVKDGKIKIGIQEAERGVIFDGSATLPMGGRQILSHNWTVTSKEGFIYTKDGDGKPSVMRLVLPGQGEYKLALTTTDNESNKITELFYVLVSDPVAIIKQMPEVGNSSITFSFDSTPSYSIVSSLKLFTREIFDQDGNKVDTFQGKSIKQQFKKPGVYTVKLTVEDELAQTNTDSLSVYVESTDPIPQFTITPSNSRKNPSEFILDASVSSDVDKINGYDHLTYERSFSNPTTSKIVNSENNNEKVVVQFDTLGKQTIKLTTRDDYGKIAEIEKDVNVLSVLRPTIFVVPIATPWGNPMNFVVKSNQPILNYQWDFADTDTRTIQTDKIAHTYKKSGIYKVVLKVSGADGMENEVSKNVFVGEKNYPVVGFAVIDKTSNVQTQNDECPDIDSGSGTVPAYRIDRYADFTIDPSLSVNTKGEKIGLQFFFQPQNNEIYKQDIFKYKFNELGCTYVDLTSEDTTISKSDKVRIYFKVVNALPKLDNLVLFFPQYGNEVGVGFKENNAKDIFNDTFDPLIVKVSATNPIDPDGFISYFKWYFYYKDDPTRAIETKITPGTIPYVFFSLPRVPGEFMFGVTMYDNDEGQQSNQDIIGNGPLVFFPPDVSRPDIPLVTLKSDLVSVEIGDEVTFDVVSKIISDRPDFIRERTIQYDFDGDGTRDLTTKSDHVQHVYTEPNELGYRPRAAVLYRGYKGIGVGGTIVVKNGLKPMLLSDAFEKLVIFRDVSLGTIAEKNICLSIKDCKNGSGFVITTGDAFTFTYPDFSKYFISMAVTDTYANIADKRRTLNLTTGTANAGDFHILSIPKVSIASGIIDFFVGKNLNNSILMYIKYDDSRGTCYVDTDIAFDNNGDGIKDNDKDFLCNELYLKKYEPKYESVVGRIYYTKADTTAFSKDFTVSFLDFQANLSPEMTIVYKEINDFINTLQAIGSTGDMSNFRTLMVGLRDGLIDQIDTKSNIVSVKDYYETKGIQLTAEQKTLLEDIFTKLTDKAVSAAGGGNIYQQSKAEILSILPSNLAVDVEGLFKEFESVISDTTQANSSQQDKRKAVLQEIINLISKNLALAGATVQTNQIDPLDMQTTIMPNMCKILAFYTIVSDACPNDNVKIVANADAIKAANATGGSTWWKIILIVLGIVVGVFIILVIVFAVRARMNQNEENGETSPESTTP